MTRIMNLACTLAALFTLIGAGPALLQAVNGTWVLAPSGQQHQWQIRLSSSDEDTRQWEESLHLDAPPSSTPFSIRRDAGTFDFTGTLAEGTGSGRFTFTPSSAFVNGLASRNLHLRSVRDLTAAAAVDLTLSYIDAIGAAGYPSLSFEKLLAFRAVGATPASIAELRSVFGQLPAEDVISTTALHVTRAYVDELHSMGVDGITPRRAVTFKALHIDKAYIEDLSRMGYAHMKPDDIVSFKAMHIDAAYLQHLREHGLKNLTPQQVIEMKATGL
ncbi:MAG: hypothetical protein ABR508_09820 [Candidatus Baltobacteraceae bacterium]